MKECTKCRKLKDISEFGKDGQKKDGLSSSCKTCVNSRNKKYRESRPEYFKKYAREYRKNNRDVLRKKSWISYNINWEKRAEESKKYYNSRKQQISIKRAIKRRSEEEKQKNRIRQKKWRSENKSKYVDSVTNWKKRNPQKSAAHTLVLWAIKTGILKKPIMCEECNKECKVEAHHVDYFKPLDIHWLCKKCHSKKHQTIGDLSIS